MVLRGRGGGRGRGFSPWSRPLTSSSRFLSLPTKGLSGPSPGPLSHDPVSEETALSPCPQAPAEVTPETDTESQPPEHLGIPEGPEESGPARSGGLRGRVPTSQGSLIPGLDGWTGWEWGIV